MDEGSVHPDPDGSTTSRPGWSDRRPDLDAVLADYARATAAVNGLDLTALVRLDSPSTGLHAVARNVELLRRRLAVFDSRYVARWRSGTSRPATPGPPRRRSCVSSCGCPR